jgi:hypothetical protein
MTVRSYIGGLTFSNIDLNSGLSKFFEVVTPYATPLPQLAPRWTVATFDAYGAVHVALLDFAPTSNALDSQFILPNRQIIKGANVVVYAQGWDGFWGEWKWEDNIKWQIDLAKSVGANTIRIIGDYFAISNGVHTVAQYRAKWRQVIDYCKSIDMYVYVCGGADPESLVTDAFVQSVLVDLAKEINNEPTVIGFDVIQEKLSRIDS